MNQKINILLVDDRPEGLVTLEAVLTEPDYNLVKAGSGREALAQVLTHDFAVILMDVQMPDMDGFETAKVIKQREKSKYIPIIFLTALNKADHNVSMGYSVGAVDYVFKPFDSQILKSKVAVFVDLYKKDWLLRQQSEMLREIEKRDRVRMINELEVEGRRRYQNLADAIPQIVMRMDTTMSVEYFNHFWHHYSGLSLKQSRGQGWKNAFHPDSQTQLEAKIAESDQSQIGFEMDCQIAHGQNGEYRWHVFSLVPEFNNISQINHWIGIATDIHDQRKIQQELTFAKKLAEDASDMKSRFLANMSHEIRTPLGAILGFSELMIDSKISHSEKCQSAAAIRRNVDLLSKIIDEILDISKVEAGKIDIEFSEMALANFLNDIKTNLSLAANDKNLELVLKVDGEIPAKVMANSVRLQQILVNIVGNAIKFSPRGQVILTAWYQKKTNSEPPYLFFSVQDPGPGLTADQIKKLFQPFTQVDSSITRKYGGTGLGLALSKKLANAMGGDINVQESQPGAGCNFIIKIKADEVPGTTFIKSLENTKTPAEARTVPENALKGVKILLVDDSIDNQILVSRFLTIEGAEVEVADNGIEGVEKALNGNHHLVLMDIQMPRLDGFGALKELGKKGYGKPVLALTAHGMQEEREHCLQAGFADHLTKPVNRTGLIDSVRRYSLFH